MSKRIRWYFRTYWEATLFAFSAVRLAEPLMAWLAVILPLAVLLGLITYAIGAPIIGANSSWNPPLNPTQAWLAFLSLIALLFAIATFRLQGKLKPFKRPLIEVVADLLNKGRVRLAILEVATSPDELAKACIESDQWRASTKKLLGEYRPDLALRMSTFSNNDQWTQDAVTRCKTLAAALRWPEIKECCEKLEEIYKSLPQPTP